MEHSITIAVNDEMFANNDGNIAHDNPVRCTLCKKRTFNTYRGMNPLARTDGQKSSGNFY